MKKEKVPLPLLYCWIRGAIGKEFVIKHYKYGTVKTRYPDMARIVASNAQRKCRNLFKEAVVYAQSILADPIKFEEWEKRTRKPRYRVFTQVVKYYMLEVKRQKEAAKQRVVRLIRKCFNPNCRKSFPVTTAFNNIYNELKKAQNQQHLLKRTQSSFAKNVSIDTIY